VLIQRLLYKRVKIYWAGKIEKVFFDLDDSSSFQKSLIPTPFLPYISSCSFFCIEILIDLKFTAFELLYRIVCFLHFLS
jgi:hypothetical protein